MQRKMGSSWILTLVIAFGISGVIAVLFYDSLWGLLIAPLVYYLTHRALKELQKERLIKQLNLEFKDYLYAVSGALSAGYSVERAFVAGLKDVEQLYGESSILRKKLSMMEKRLGIQEPIEHILRDFASESGSEDIENFVEVFCYAKRSGGDFIHIIGTTVGRICDKMEVLEEIHTVIAQKSLEQKVMFVVPLGILLFFKVSSPEFIDCLYGNLLGVGVMTIALLLYGIAFFLGMKFLKIEV